MTWFNFKKYPEFYKTYLDKFKGKQPKSIENTRFVIFDTETTGLNTNKDKILSIGAIAVINNSILVDDSFEVYLNQTEFNKETVKIHGLLKDGKMVKISEKDAIENFLNFIGNSILIAHHAAFDIEIINTSLKKLKLPTLKNKFIDTGVLYKKLEGKKNNHFSLDKLCAEFNIPKSDRHIASGDAFITAQLFLKIISKLKQERTVQLSDLYRNNYKKGLL